MIALNLPIVLFLLTFLSLHVSASDVNDCAFSEYALNDSNTLKVRSSETHMTVVMESSSEAWLGVGVSEEGLMIGTVGIIGSPSVGVKKYNLLSQEMEGVRISTEQTLVNATFVQGTEDVAGSRLTYTQLLKDGDQEVSSVGKITLIWAVGEDNFLGFHPERGSIEINLEPCKKFEDDGSGSTNSGVIDKRSLKAHGIIATFAFGLLMPIAILASSFREHLAFEICSKKAWFLFHGILMSISALLALVIFILAIAAKKKSKGLHFRRAHEIVGLLLLIVVFLQVILAVFRPDNKEHVSQEEDVENDDKGEKGTPPTTASSENNFTKRSMWEKGHKLMGYVIIFVGSYQIKSGLNIYQLFFGESKVWITLYWVWLGIVYFLVILGVYRLFSN